MPSLLVEVASYQDVVATVSSLVEELESKFRLDNGYLGDSQQSAGIFVDVMNKPHYGVVDIKRGQIFWVSSHGANQCSTKVSSTWMHHHTGRSVNHHEVGIFTYDTQGNVFGLNGVAVLWRIRH